MIIFSIAKFFSLFSIPSKANKKTVEQFATVNLAQNQAGVFWQTTEKELGWVIFGESESNLSKISQDERDLQDKKNHFYNHYVILRNLQPGTTYFYKIVSDNQIVESSEQKPFSFKTPTILSANADLRPAYGRLINSNGIPLENAVIRLFFENSIPLLALSKQTGEWLIPLNFIIDNDSLQIKNIDLNDLVKLEIKSEEKEKTSISLRVKDLSPLPQTIIIGKDYNFENSEDVLSVSSGKKLLENDRVQILYPKDGAIIPGDSPLIKGTAIPGEEVMVVIKSETSNEYRAKVDKDGIWRVLVTRELLPGEHIITITTKDQAGKKIQLVRKFTIAKSGEQVLGEATAEATPTLTLAPTVYSTPISTPTVSYSPYITQPATFTVTPPTSGLNLFPLGIASMSLVVIGLGILIAF